MRFAQESRKAGSWVSKRLALLVSRRDRLSPFSVESLSSIGGRHFSNSALESSLASSPNSTPACSAKSSDVCGKSFSAKVASVLGVPPGISHSKAPVSSVVSFAWSVKFSILSTSRQETLYRACLGLSRVNTPVTLLSSSRLEVTFTRPRVEKTLSSAPFLSSTCIACSTHPAASCNSGLKVSAELLRSGMTKERREGGSAAWQVRRNWTSLKVTESKPRTATLSNTVCVSSAI